jgi:aromatic-L-amino-acid/L-tryptophan decarboxylase
MQGIDMSDVFVSLIRGSDLFTLVTEPSLALSVFRLAPSSHANASLQELNALNKALHARLSARSAELYLTQTDLNGVFCFRMAIGASRTEEHHVRRAFDVLEEEARIVLSGNGSIPGHAASTELGGGVQESTMAQVTKET